MGRTFSADPRQPATKTAILWRTVQEKMLYERHEKPYKDSLEVSLKNFGICDNTREILSQICTAWCIRITSGARDAKDRRLDEAEMRRGV